MQNKCVSSLPTHERLTKPPVAPPQYLTTVIPYSPRHPPSPPALATLNKVLKAMNEDSPTVPALLTDYILKGSSQPSSLTTSSKVRARPPH